MNFMTYIHLIREAEQKAKSEGRTVDAQDLYFMDYLLQIAEKDKNLEKIDLVVIQNVVKIYVDKYNRSIENENLFFEIDFI